ncbi:MAG: DUF5690 family protein, partial [Myxococcota bacterium]|nr:DUF5690 family protein [Myxococcota bacterium]
MKSSRVERWLASSSTGVFAAWVMGAAFATYFCMYAFRKPFAVGTFAGEVELPGLPPLDLKILFIISQVIGYASSKFLGIKIVSELQPHRRALAILAFIGLAEFALLLFAIVPAPYNALAMVLNGLPLGMIWGLVFGFLEGRETSDLLGAGLCASFILASGFTKMVGKVLMDAGIPELWMPFCTGLLFFAPLLFFLWMLVHIPEPTEADIRARTRREPMNAESRRAFFKAFAPGLVLLIAGYIVLTAYRDFRDNFARELWDALGYSGEPSIFTTAELPIAFGSLLAIALVVRVRDNRKALRLVHGIMIGGALLTLGSTILFQLGILGPAPWMICVGLGLYLGYVPVNCVLFDRMIAAVGQAATAGFLIYVADASGYVGSVALLLYKSFSHADLSWLDFFLGASYVTGVLCTIVFF